MMTRGFAVLLALVLATGIAALGFETDGCRVVTSAGARQLSVERTPQVLPDAHLVDQDGTPFTLGAYSGRTVLVDFIYTRCPTICGVLGNDFAGMLQSTKARRSGAGAGAPIDLLSISFDPTDDQDALRLYGERFGAKAPRWRIAAPADAKIRAALLRSFGVVVIPDGSGGFIHDDAVYVIDARGRLARILDPDTPAQLAAKALKVAAAP
jgi:protein SCO1